MPRPGPKLRQAPNLFGCFEEQSRLGAFIERHIVAVIFCSATVFVLGACFLRF